MPNKVTSVHIVFDCPTCGEQVALNDDTDVSVCTACGTATYTGDGHVYVYNGGEFDTAAKAIAHRRAEEAAYEASEECPSCGGDGVAFVMAEMGGDPEDGTSIDCEYCKGTGRVPKEPR